DFLFKLATSEAYAVPSHSPLTTDLKLPATGPYMVLRYRANRGLVLVRNPRFRVWNPAAQPGGYPERIVWTFYSSGASKTWDAGTAAAVRAVRLRRADYMNDAATAAAALGRAGYVSQLHISPAFATIYLVFNTRVPPFDNVNARRAVNYAIDRTHLVG